MRVHPMSDRRGDESGVVALVVSVLLATVLVLLAAFVTDFGYAYSNKRQMQNGVDAAALAAAQHVLEKAPANKTCAQLAADINSSGDSAWPGAGGSTTQTEARSFFRQNMPNLKASVPPQPVTASCPAGLGLELAVQASMPSDSFFGVITGQSSIPVSTDAAAVVGPGDNVIGLRPIGICDKRAADAKANPGGIYALPLEDKGDPYCGLGMSDWGLLNFDGSRGNKNLKDCTKPNDGLESDIVCGYDKPVASDEWIDGDPGTRTSLEEDIGTLVGQDVTFPVYDDYKKKTGFHVIGFLTAHVCAINTKKAADSESPCVLGPSDTLTIIHKKFSVVADLNTNCALASVCDAGARVVKLAE